VGDTRLEMLVNHIITHDHRLIRKGIELFDWSHWKTGFVAERYPSHVYQLSLTFSMIWVLMLRDYAYWQNDPVFVRDRLTGMRCLLENFRSILNQDGLLEGMPGWSFMDWVSTWKEGCAPDGARGVSSIVNLLFINALEHAADLEEAYGEPSLAKRNRALAASVAAQVKKFFWKKNRNLFADDLKARHYSEHAQVLALLAGILSKQETEKCFNALITEKKLSRTTIYFSFYLLETFYKFNRGDLIVNYLDLWRGLVKMGMKTTIEMPEPGRSDCHAWGAHPLFHFHASLAGIRPAAPGFTSVIIAPLPGNLSHLESKLPHPQGFIETKLVFDHQRQACQAWIKLPPRTTGIFRWQKKTYKLQPGKNSILVKGRRQV
jgi:hypothetical protein